MSLYKALYTNNVSFQERTEASFKVEEIIINPEFECKTFQAIKH